jgi:hypothetical protein
MSDTARLQSGQATSPTARTYRVQRLGDEQARRHSAVDAADTTGDAAGMAAMRKCPSCGEPCADWRTECPGCGAAFVVRETRKVPVIDEGRGELQQLVKALEEGRPVPPRVAGRSTRTVTVTRDVTVSPRPDSAPTRAGIGCGRVVLAVASVAAVIVGIVYFPLQTIATCAVLAVLSGGYYFVVIVRR